MNKDLIISSNSKELFIAILENGKLLELYREKINKNFSVGDIYIGNIKNISQNLNAVFVDIGSFKDAFLHYHDLGPNIKLFIEYIYVINNKKNNQCLISSNKYLKNNFNINKYGNINNVLKIGQKILVQITKESIYNKGPRLTSEISIAGRYLVLIPLSEKIFISQKIKDSIERKRLIKIIKIIKPKYFGIIIRTLSVNKNLITLQSDLIILLNKWKEISISFMKKNIPFKILSESNKIACILRDNFNNSFTSIICEDEYLYKCISIYLDNIITNKNNILKLYKGSIPIFEKYGVERQIKTCLGKNIPLVKGAYLIIEHTEALHVIDVNSGININNLEDNNKNNYILEINIAAANEIARQLRLRDMGGIIVIDFIDMISSKDKEYLFLHLKKIMEKDKAKHKILPPSKFGLVEITRQRVRPELNIITNEPNPNISKEIISPLTHIRNIELKLENILKYQKNKKIFLHIHPFISAYLKYGFFSIRFKWFIRYQKWIYIISRDSFNYLQYKFLNEKNKILSSYKN